MGVRKVYIYTNVCRSGFFCVHMINLKVWVHGWANIVNISTRSKATASTKMHRQTRTYWTLLYV